MDDLRAVEGKGMKESIQLPRFPQSCSPRPTSPPFLDSRLAGLVNYPYESDDEIQIDIVFSVTSDIIDDFMVGPQLTGQGSNFPR